MQPIDTAQPTTAHPHGRIDVLGSKISGLTCDSALEFLEQKIGARGGGYVCFTNVHAVVIGLHDEEFRKITNNSLLSLADGKPVYWAARQKGTIGHVPGPDFMIAAVTRLKHRRHFFYGSTPEVLSKLQGELTKIAPEIRICGSLSPPFRALTQTDKDQHYAVIRESGADLVWVGLGAPKQERWMSEACVRLDSAILLGVGAAFDFHAGVVPRAPRLMRSMGLERLRRLSSSRYS